MILTFESFQNSLSKVSTERHLEVLEAAKEAVNSAGTSEEGNATLNFLILFAQTYGTTCENWMDLDDSISLAKLYAVEEYDFTTLSVVASHVDRHYFDQPEYTDMVNKTTTLERNGWKLFKKYEDAMSPDPNSDKTYTERFFDLIFYRPKYLASNKINKANQRTGVFESWKKSQKIYKRDDVKFKDMYQETKIEFAKTFNLKVIDKLKDVGFNVEVIGNEGDSACEILVNTIPMHIVNSNELCFDNEKIYDGSFTNIQVFEILKSAGLDPFIGGPKFSTATSLQYFFDKMDLNLYVNSKLQKSLKIGVFDKD